MEEKWLTKFAGKKLGVAMKAEGLIMWRGCQGWQGSEGEDGVGNEGGGEEGEVRESEDGKEGGEVGGMAGKGTCKGVATTTTAMMKAMRIHGLVTRTVSRVAALRT